MNMSYPSFLAFDIGASSGRAILGSLDNKKLTVREIYRFPNNMILRNGHYYWDIYKLFEEIKEGLDCCINREKIIPESIAVDTWGVDFVLLDRNGEFIDLPFAYRDSLFEGKKEEFFQRMSAEELYNLTGLQFLPFNSVFQLYAISLAFPDLLKKAVKLLFMPDAINYFLTGETKSEFTIASTSQLLNSDNNDWEKKIFDIIGISNELMCDIIYPGETIGYLNKNLCKQFGIDTIKVVAAGSHDTASAIAATPAEGRNWAYLSSGTWSLMGVELEKRIVNTTARELQFTNEGGIEKTIRFLKNISGLWLLQECKKNWDREKDYSFADLIESSGSATPFRSIIDPDAAVFLNPEDMEEAIKEFCRKTDQLVPANRPSIVRCILESLALKYRYVIDQLTKLHPEAINDLFIIGGGSKNHVLNQYTANATGLQVTAGPAEATSIGNILMQAKALGYLSSLQEMRSVTMLSFELKTFVPEDVERWNDVFKGLKIY